MKAWGIVVAAGRGTRFGREKHDLILGDRPLWQWARSCLLDGGLEEVIVVGPVEGGIEGGERRRDSVAAGLALVPQSVPAVVVHDAVRPMAGSGLVRQLLDRLAAGDVAGVIPGIPIRDTVKRVAGDRIVSTVSREGLVGIQTPQVFLTSALREAHAASNEDASDDAVLIERIGKEVAWIEGEPHNLKVTYPDDLRVLEAFLT
jgi:2-C-methyl-D-erythritol 4-phosphate cytidylyltransferase